jgi:hypothetical protein
MINAAKGVIGSGPSRDPDAPRVHRYGDDLDRDIRAAIRAQRGTSSPAMFRGGGGRTLEDTIRMAVNRCRYGPDNERC